MKISIEDLVAYLNEMCELSSQAVGHIIGLRTLCGYVMRKDHRITPVVTPGEYGTPTIGMLELLNGMFHDSGKRIAAKYSPDDRLVGFFVETSCGD